MSGVGSSPALATCETRQVLLAGLSGGFPGVLPFCPTYRLARLYERNNLERDKLNQKKKNYELHLEKICFRGYQPCPTQTRLYCHRRWLTPLISDLGSIYVAKTRALISCTVTAWMICVFVFANPKNRFSHDTAHIFLFLARLHEVQKSYCSHPGRTRSRSRSRSRSTLR